MLCFEQVSINLRKSQIIPFVVVDKVDLLATNLRYAMGSLPSVCLCLLLVVKYKSIRVWDLVV